MRNRYVNIDIARGLGILLVVLGHNWISFNPKGELFNIIYSFHMPLFFVLAGVFFKQSANLGALARARLDALIKPYVVTLLLFALALQASGNLQIAEYIYRVIHGTGESLRELYGEEGQTVYWTPLWFLPHLFALTLTAWLAVALARAARLTELQQGVALALLFLTGLFTIDPGNVTGLPFSIDLLPITVVFFLLGFAARDLFLAFKPSLLLCCAALVIFCLCHLLWDETIDLNRRVYGNALLSTLQLGTGIYLVMALSCLLGRYPLIAKAMAYVGEAGLIILVFHSFIQIKAYYLISTSLGVEGLLPALVAFLLASALPVLLFYLFQRVPLLGVFYLPFKAVTGRAGPLSTQGLFNARRLGRRGE